MSLRNQDQVTKLHHELIRKHNLLLAKQKYAVGVIEGPARLAMERGIERAAGFIQALEWVRNPEIAEPDWLQMIDRLIEA